MQAEYKFYVPEKMKEIPIFEVDSKILNETIADYLKSQSLIKLPEYHNIIKTGIAKEMPPSDADWFYKRTAGIFRSVILNLMSGKENGIGTHFLTRKYSSKLNRGVRPSKMTKASAGHLKDMLSSLEKIKWIKKVEVGYKADLKGIAAMKEFIDKLKTNEATV